jgi:hypothetical protein
MIYETFQMNSNQSQGFHIVADEGETVDLAKTQLHTDGNVITNKAPLVEKPPVEEPKKSYLWVVLLIISLLLVVMIIFFILRRKRVISEENDE